MYGFKECSSCETLYNKSCGCTKGGFIDKFLCDPNKTPDSSQRPPHDCPKCGNPGDGLNCRQCALLRKKLKEVWFTICDENEIFQDFLNTSESFNDNTNVINAPQEPFVFNQDPDENSSQSPPRIDHHCCYGCGDSLDAKVLLLAWDRISEIKDAFGNKQYKLEGMQELFRKLFNDVQNIHKELAEYINTPSWNRPAFYNNDEDDDEDYTIAITLDFLIMDSLSMGDEHLSTIPEKESDEFIYDDESFSDEDVPKKIYSNSLFDKEIISIKIDPHHFNVESNFIESLLNQDSSIISSSKIDSLLDEFASELIFLKSIPPGIDEVDYDLEEEIRLIEKLLYDNSSPRPSKEFNSKNSDVIIESFSPSPIPVEDIDSLMEEIDLSLSPDDSMPSGIENDDYDSEGDILFLKELLSNDSLLLPENESFHFDVPSSPRPPAKPLDDDEIKPDTGILTFKVVGDISEHYVLMPRLLPTLALNEEKFPHLLSYRGFKAFQLSSESPMMIYGGDNPTLDVLFLHLYPP
uniref:Uncharacterized protein n=1 Tax=Tanacetum cinerariifolium TaxID=118510 RepID=A0A6L2JIP6_TANCI|nr:hypothetical protein [Tanacetum cinerariifolium]